LHLPVEISQAALEGECVRGRADHRSMKADDFSTLKLHSTSGLSCLSVISFSLQFIGKFTKKILVVQLTLSLFTSLFHIQLSILSRNMQFLLPLKNSFHSDAPLFD
jgi:hypothetical protein